MHIPVHTQIPLRILLHSTLCILCVTLYTLCMPPRQTPNAHVLGLANPVCFGTHNPPGYAFHESPASGLLQRVQQCTEGGGWAITLLPSTPLHLAYCRGSSSVAQSQAFALKQFHFHSPSEHTIDGQYYPLEMHMVHVCEVWDAVK